MITPSTLMQSNVLARWNAWKVGPRPRIVRLREGYRFWGTLLAATCVIIPSLLLLFLIAEWRTKPAKQVMNSDFWSAMPFIVLPLIFLLFTIWSLVGQKRLVARGEISIGKVTEVRSRRRSVAVTYEFIDISGRLITTSSSDDTRSFSPGMPVPVFYDSECPATKQIALCGSAYEVVDIR